MQRAKLFISIAIVLIIGLHALPVLQELRGSRQAFWPIMAWGMYRSAHDPKRPIQTIKRQIVAITAGGETLHIGPPEAGLGYFAFARFYLGPMSTGDSSAARQLVARISRDQDDPIVEIRLERETYMITDSGLVREISPVITYRLDGWGL
jgi:hypothetical protein